MYISQDIVFSNKTKIDKEKYIGIYFLLKDEEIVYIGQTKNYLARILAHRDKDFDSYSFINVKESELDIVESMNILKYQPKYNKCLLSNIHFTINSINTILYKATGHRNLRSIKKSIKENGFESVKYNGLDVYTVEQAKKVLKDIGVYYDS